MRHHQCYGSIRLARHRHYISEGVSVLNLPHIRSSPWQLPAPSLVSHVWYLQTAYRRSSSNSISFNYPGNIYVSASMQTLQRYNTGESILRLQECSDHSQICLFKSSTSYFGRSSQGAAELVWCQSRRLLEGLLYAKFVNHAGVLLTHHNR